jgi:hypothetical protein
VVGIPAPSILDADVEDLVLRICNSARRGQIVRLRSRKCTIGSGPRCTLRLRARGVQPLHCLILRGAPGAAIRCYASDTRLNGRAFDDARLAPGDRLSIGPLDFEVLDEQQQALQGQSEQTGRARAELDARQAELDLRQKEIGVREDAADARQKDLDGREAKLDATREALDSLQADLDARSAELDTRQADLDGPQAELDQRRAEMDRLHAGLQQRESQANERCAEIGERRADLERRETELNERQAALDERQAALDERQAALDERQAELDARESEIDQTSPESSEEILRRLGIVPSLADEDGQPEDERQEAEREETELGPAPPRPTRGEGTDSASGSGADESIDDYMARLLDRVRSGAGPSGHPVAARPAAEPAPVQRPGSESAPEPAERAIEPPEPANLAPRAVAPERSVDLGAMRDLANLSAEAAINRYARRIMLGAATRKLIVAIVSLVAGGVLAWIWWTRSRDRLTFFGASASFVIGLLFALQYILLGGRALFARPNRKRKRTKHAADPSGQQPERPE